MQPVARYLPRSKRCGVDSNLRSVNARVLGPMKGLQPMVNVMPSAISTKRATKPISRPFPRRDMASPQKWCKKTSGHFRTAKVHEDGVFLTKMVTMWTPSVHAGRREVRRGISLMILGLKTNCGSDLSLRNVISQQEEYFAPSLF